MSTQSSRCPWCLAAGDGQEPPVGHAAFAFAWVQLTSHHRLCLFLQDLSPSPALLTQDSVLALTPAAQG